jgi:predicted MFS family arabinose efflux permease
MSRLVARILLAVLMLPAAAMVYIVTVFALDQSFRRNESVLMIASGCVMWGFIVGYWLILWHGMVDFTPRRIGMTILAAIISILIGSIIGGMVAASQPGFGAFVGSVAAPLCWLIGVTFIWRETAEERTERIRAITKSAVVCPKCGYNLTGLQTARCPECGSQFTLDELLAAQPNRAEAGSLE